MLELGLAGFLTAFLALGLRRPFLWVLCYLYVDVVAPQKISYSLLTSVPVSLIAFVAAFGGWLILDDKHGVRFTFRQTLLVMLLFYCGYTTLTADFPVEAAGKWSWVWKALVVAIFLPMTLRTRLRIEATVLVLVLSASSIIITGGIKTVLGGGGYGTLNFFVNDNSGLYEGSTLSMASVAIIPLIVWLARFGTVFPPGKLVRLYAAALIFACLLIPIGTQTRTGLLCIGVLAVLSLRTVKRRFLYMTLLSGVVLVAIPFLPESYTQRMNTIENHQSDQSASTRLAVWKWTIEYAKDHPLGGGFESYLSNRVRLNTTTAETSGSTTTIESTVIYDEARAFHSAYFEMLGEQGWPGLAMWLALQVLGLVQLEMLRWRLRGRDDPVDRSDAALGNALQQGHVVYLVGATFVGIAFQPFIYMLIALQIALVQRVARREQRRAPPRPTRPARALTGPEPETP